MDLVPIKVKIGLKSEGGRMQHAFPKFNLLPAAVRDNMDWSHFIDKFGGWYYDKVAGHDKEDSANGSPQGTWLGLLLVPEDFADAALAQFPDLVSELTEAETVDFYENRCTVYQPEIEEDEEAMKMVDRRIAEKPSNRTIDPDVKNALDPDHPAPGRRKNMRKKLVDRLSHLGHAIKQGRRVPK